MDLNTATYSELLTLLNIGEVGAASIVMGRWRETVSREMAES